MVITNEALDALSVNEKWLHGIDDKREGVIINQSGKALKVPVTTPFTWKTGAVVTEGIVGILSLTNPIYEIMLARPESSFHYLPTYQQKRNGLHGWRNYLRHIVIQ